MPIVLAVVLLIVSFLAIGVITERYFIPSLENIARWLKLPDNVAGATLLAFGSSAPELFTALITLLLLQSRASFGVGSIVGSALFQILVVIGFAAVVKTSYLRWRPVIRDGIMYGVAVVLLYFFARDGVFTVTEGSVFVGSYLVYLIVLILWSKFVHPPQKKQTSEQENDADGRIHAVFSKLSIITAPVVFILSPLPNPQHKPKWTLPVFLLSLIVIGGGAYVFVRAGETIAQALGLDPTIIALTIIAGGSSVPELVSSGVVAARGKGDMAIANALGSNTFDIFISLGLPVLITTLVYGSVENIGGANITTSVILLFATLVMVIGVLAIQKFKASRAFGGLLLLSYGAYVVAAYQGWIG